MKESKNVHKLDSPMMGVVLAAGKGKRMGSPLPKMLHSLLGKTLVSWVLESMGNAQIEPIFVVLPQTKGALFSHLQKHQELHGSMLHFCIQSQPLGTGHALRCALDQVIAGGKTLPQNVMVGFGDTPAITAKTYQDFMAFHKEQSNDITVLAFHPEKNKGYGRIVRDGENRFVAIREEKDCSPQEALIPLCNSSLMCGTFQCFEQYTRQLTPSNASGEYYLTDVPNLAIREGKKVGCYVCPRHWELEGVNTPEQLENLERHMLHHPSLYKGIYPCVES